MSTTGYYSIFESVVVGSANNTPGSAPALHTGPIHGSIFTTGRSHGEECIDATG